MAKQCGLAIYIMNQQAWDNIFGHNQAVFLGKLIRS